MAKVPSFDLKGQIAIVSGASRGIGESIAHALAANGAHVICTSRKVESVQGVAESIRANGGSAEALPCHIGDLEAIDKLYETVAAKHDRLDILVNNAAANPYFGPIQDTDLAAFQKTVDVNIRGYFFMSARAVKLMQKRSYGAILNLSSINAFVPGAYQGIYSITKAAILSMTQSFAKEVGHLGIRVNALAPGLTDTKFASTLVNTPSISEKFLERTPLGRVAQPEEMAGAALYLVSPASSYTTGTVLTVDGGILIG
ncbi:MAG TPA: SDR family oxidoreductase [Polyangiales bacterium]|nr:SDR family oxidoreductase [Polyangiales bacterium]